MTVTDPFDILVAARPAAERGPLAPGDDPRIDALFRRTLAVAAAPRDVRAVHSGRDRWRRRLVGGGLVIGLIGGSAVAAAVLIDDGPSDPTVITCWAGDRRVDVAADPDVSPVEACRRLWTDGTLGSPPAPALTLCAFDPGGYAVLPGESGDVCVANGLDPVDEFDPVTDAAMLTTVRELDARIRQPLAATCMGEQASIELVDSVLALEQFEGWTRAPGPDFTRDCGTVIVHAPTKTLTLVARERPPDVSATAAPPRG